MDDDPELQRALLLSMGGSTAGDAGYAHPAVPAAPTPAWGSGEDDEEAQLQQAILASHGLASNVMPQAGAASDIFGCVGQATPEARKLLLTVVTNLERASASDCDPAQAAKFRQLNDEIVRKRVERTDSPEASYALVAKALEHLGFKLESVTEGDSQAVRRWLLAPDAAAATDSALREQFRVALAQERQATPSVVPSSASTPISAQCMRQKPQSIADFEVLDLASTAGLPPLTLFVYPKGFAYLVKSPDCVAWASATKSGRSHWGSHGRRGEDDRVMMTLYCGFGNGHVACSAHWCDHRGDEKTRPTISCYQGQWNWCTTYMRHIFVLRLAPQQQVALAGLQITSRPFATDGHLLILVLPRDSSALALQETCRLVGELPNDDREPTCGTSGRRPAPPPPSAKHFR